MTRVGCTAGHSQSKITNSGAPGTDGRAIYLFPRRDRLVSRLRPMLDRATIMARGVPQATTTTKEEVTMKDKPNVYINPKAPESLKDLVRDAVPDANSMSAEEAVEKMEEACDAPPPPKPSRH